jgi:uncharacterized membrane protein YidH (DUF202 family)
MSLRQNRWARYLLTVVAFAIGLANLLISTVKLRQAGWSNERTILFAAEGGLMSPREALMDVVLFGGGSMIWFFIFGATIAPPNTRTRWVFRGAVTGTVLELVLATAAGALCGDLWEHFVVGLMLAFPTLALVMAAIWRWRPSAG